MMNKIVTFIISGIISLIFFLFTGWGAFHSHIPVLHDFSTVFHFIPFVIGFTTGMTFWIYLYYFVSWLFLTLFVKIMISAFSAIKKQPKKIV